MIARLLSLVLTLSLAGCASGEGDAGGNYQVITVDVNGRTVPCVIWSINGYGGGITCDWTAP